MRNPKWIRHTLNRVGQSVQDKKKTKNKGVKFRLYHAVMFKMFYTPSCGSIKYTPTELTATWISRSPEVNHDDIREVRRSSIWPQKNAALIFLIIANIIYKGKSYNENNKLCLPVIGSCPTAFQIIQHQSLTGNVVRKFFELLDYQRFRCSFVWSLQFGQRPN